MSSLTEYDGLTLRRTDSAAIVNALGYTPANASTMVSANPVSVIASGSGFSVTTSASSVDFGTTDPSITLNAPGTYLIIATAKIDYNAATFLAVRNLTLKLRRMNNTPADVISSVLKTQVITALTFTMPPVMWTTVYTTNNSNDIINIVASIDTGPSAGTLDINEATITAIRLQM